MRGVHLDLCWTNVLSSKQMFDHPQHLHRIFHKNMYLMLTFLKLQKGDKCYMFDTHMFHKLILEVAGLAYLALG